jgi:hypothetical protein
VVLSTVNPLFLDSTKPVGDKIVTNVELAQVILHDGESLFFEVKETSGSAQKFEMREMITKKSVKFKTEIWLKRQQQIQYRFVIEFEGQPRLASEFRKSFAGNTINDTWRPCVEIPAAKSNSSKKPTLQTGSSTAAKTGSKQKSRSSKALFESQDLGEIKSLLDDLL